MKLRSIEMATYNSPTQTPTYYNIPSRTERADDELDAVKDIVEYLREYAREKPEVAALWCLGIGFILGWKLKPW
jgi:hypothetical protein